MKKRIVVSFLRYPMSIGAYFEAALRRRDDVELYTTGPFFGTYIPWDGGMHIPGRYAKAPDLPLPVQNYQHIPINYVENQLPWEPDLWLQIDAGFCLWGKPAHGKNVIVGTDPHVLAYDIQRRFAHTFYCMQSPYMRTDDVYLPYGYDPIWHAPEEQPQNYDVCLIGLHYPQRDELVAELRKRGLNVYYDLGPVYDEARALYNQAPIGLNWSSKQDLTARVFELLGMRRLAIVNDVPDLSRFFENGKDLITFTTLQEAVDWAMFYHENKAGAWKIAQQGYETVREHTWDRRIEQILEGM